MCLPNSLKWFFLLGAFGLGCVQYGTMFTQCAFCLVTGLSHHSRTNCTHLLRYYHRTFVLGCSSGDDLLLLLIFGILLVTPAVGTKIRSTSMEFLRGPRLFHLLLLEMIDTTTTCR